MSSPRFRFALAVVLLAATTVPLIIAHHEAATDDVYITYRYAQNLAQGQGLVFNPGERVFGTTAPGLALLLAGLHRLTAVSIPWLGNVLTAIAVVLLAAVLTSSRPPEGGRLSAFLGGLLFALSPQVWVNVGSEYPVALALVASAAALAKKQPVAAGCLAALAAWVRPDAVLGLGALAVLLWTTQRRLPWRFGVAATLTLSTGFLLAIWWFGRALPATLDAKRIQADIGTFFWKSGWAFWTEGFRFVQDFTAGPVALPLLAIGLAGAILLLRQGSLCERTVVFYGLALAVAYPLLGVPFYIWYATPLVSVLLCGFAAVVVRAAAAAARFFGSSWLAWLIASGLVVALFGRTAGTLVSKSVPLAAVDRVDRRFDAYRGAGRWLAEHARPGDRVAYVEIGTLAFYSRMPVIDLLGLVTPQSLPYIAAKDLEGAFLRDPTTFVVSDQPLGGFIHSILRADYFAIGYSQAAHLRAADGGMDIWVYRAEPAAALPPPRPPRPQEDLIRSSRP